MKKLLILGGGTGGTMMANKMRKALPAKEWEISLIDKNRTHYYQPGFLFIPFGIYSEKDVIKPKDKFFPKGVNIIYSEIDRIEAEAQHVFLKGGKQLNYDYLIIATGTDISPEMTPGLKGELWQKNIFDFYTVEGALAMQQFLEKWEGGRLVVCISELPLKCPVAPLEFAFLAEAFFSKKKMRDKVKITYVTPLPGAFTKPVATRMLSGLLKEKGIEVITDFYLERVDNENSKLISYDEREVGFDLLAIVPVNKGDEAIARSGLGDDLNYIPTDKHTMQSKQYRNIYVIGDSADLPTSKAGSVAHFAGEIIEENLLSAIRGEPLEASFDGHANCYIETGYGKGSLIDFNYETEPLPGTFPLPVVGPFGLLKNTRLNHYGKMFFRWIYWNLLLKGRKLPVSTQMSMVGKIQPENIKEFEYSY